MKKVRLLISYDGTDYCGWQRQGEHKHSALAPSIQETLEKALSQLFAEPISMSASGRTDSGVHAVGQVGHFETSKPLPKDICWALRSLLPPSIAIKAAWEAPEDFHATLSATHKTYRYWVWNHSRPTALLSRYSYWIRRPLNIEYLNSFSEFLEQKRDFESFRNEGTPVHHTVREIYSAKWTRKRGHLLEFEVTGTGFLKQMVRTMVGTQLQLFMRGRPASDIHAILEAKDRRKAGPTAPPQGLFLYRVYYPKELDNRCRQI